MRSRLPYAVAALSCALLPACNESDEPEEGGDLQTIGAEGGVLASGPLRITIPPGALATPTEFSIGPTTDAPIALGIAYRVSPATPLNADATVEYNFTVAEVGSRDPNTLVVGRDVGGQYEPLRRTDINFDTQLVTCLDAQISLNYGLIVSNSIPGATDTDTDAGSETDGDTDTDTDAPTTGTPTTTTDTPTGTMGTTAGETDGESTTTGGTDSSSSSDDTSDTTGVGECGDGAVNTGEVCFIEGLAFDAPAGPRAVLADDINGDGDADLIVAGGVSNEIEVRLGNGSGILIGDATYAVGTNPSALALANIDGAGEPDIIVTNEGDNTVGVLLSTGVATYGEHAGYAISGNGPRALSLADINEDTFLDVATANTNAGVGIVLGDGAGAFGMPASVDVGGVARGVAVDDFSGDDNVDVVSIVGSDLVLNAGNGAGLFGAPATTAIGSAATALAIADFNGDLADDAAVASEGLITIALGNGVGGFGGGVPFAVGAGTVAIAIGDVSSDGELDIITVDETDQTVTILTGNGLGAFEETFTFSVGAAPSAVALADFNGDGVDDIAVTNFDDDDTTLLLSDP